jgi:hypothetical protein
MKDRVIIDLVAALKTSLGETRRQPPPQLSRWTIRAIGRADETYVGTELGLANYLNFLTHFKGYLCDAERVR